MLGARDGEQTPLGGKVKNSIGGYRSGHGGLELAPGEDLEVTAGFENPKHIFLGAGIYFAIGDEGRGAPCFAFHGVAPIASASASIKTT